MLVSKTASKKLGTEREKTLEKGEMDNVRKCSELHRWWANGSVSLISGKSCRERKEERDLQRIVQKSEISGDRAIN